MKQKLFSTNSLFTTVFIDFPKLRLTRSSPFSPTNKANVRSYSTQVGFTVLQTLLTLPHLLFITKLQRENIRNSKLQMRKTGLEKLSTVTRLTSLLSSPDIRPIWNLPYQLTLIPPAQKGILLFCYLSFILCESSVKSQASREAIFLIHKDLSQNDSPGVQDLTPDALPCTVV